MSASDAYAHDRPLTQGGVITSVRKRIVDQVPAFEPDGNIRLEREYPVVVLPQARINRHKNASVFPVGVAQTP